MDILRDILPWLLTAITGVVSWYAGRRQRNNDFLVTLQGNITLLTDNNAKLLGELLELRKANIEIQTTNANLNASLTRLQAERDELSLEIRKLRHENAVLLEKIEQLSNKIDHKI